MGGEPGDEARCPPILIIPWQSCDGFLGREVVPGCSQAELELREKDKPHLSIRVTPRCNLATKKKVIKMTSNLGVIAF